MVMTNSELISLFAIIVTLLTTLIGWIFTYRSQRKTQQEVAKLNEKFSIEREKRQYKLNKLNEMESWFHEGMKLSMDEMARNYKKVVENPDTEPSLLFRSYREQSLIWMASIPKFYALAGQYDPISTTENTPVSKKESKRELLSQLVINFGQEVTNHIDYLVHSNTESFVVKSPEKLLDLNVEGIRAIERVRQNILKE
jgi:hypothetical protein